MPSKLNEIAQQYSKMQDPKWKVGTKKNTEEFSKGADSSGSGKMSWDNLKKSGNNLLKKVGIK